MRIGIGGANTPLDPSVTGGSCLQRGLDPTPPFGNVYLDLSVLPGKHRRGCTRASYTRVLVTPRVSWPMDFYRGPKLSGSVDVAPHDRSGFVEQPVYPV